MLRPHERSVGVIIDLNTFGSPNQIYCELRRHDKFDGAFKAVGPTGNRPERDLSQSNARIRSPISPPFTGQADAPPPSPLRWGRDRGMDTGRAE